MREEQIFHEALQQLGLTVERRFSTRRVAAMRPCASEWSVCCWADDSPGSFLQSPYAAGGRDGSAATETQISSAAPSALTSSASRSATGRSAWSTWPSRPSRSTARWPSRSSSPAWTRERSSRRFEAERQALALMDHPNIARVLDAGTSDQGRPYFVMELVHGVAITEFCDSRKLERRTSAWSCSSTSAAACSTPIKRASSTAT